MIRNYHNHKTEKEPDINHKTPGRQKSKATISLFPIKMITKLEWTQSNPHQNIEQLQNPTKTEFRA